MSDSSGFSRRDLLGGAGMTAGALAALGATLPMLGGSSIAQGAVKRTFAGSGLALEIDGGFAGLLTGADGGGAAAARIQRPAGSGQPATMALGTYVPKPITLTFGSGISAKALDWFNARDSAPRNVDVILIDITGARELYRLSMRGARVANFGISKLDAASNESLEFSVTLQPESSAQVLGQKAATLPAIPKSKVVRSNLFKFFIQGLEQATQQTRTLENISFTRNISSEVFGQSRDSVVSSLGALTMDTLKASLSLGQAGPLYQWVADILKGKPAERAGQIQLLATDGKTPVATIDLMGLLPMSVSTPFDGAASGDRIELVSIELLVADIRFNLKELGA